MAHMEKHLTQTELAAQNGLEVEITSASLGQTQPQHKNGTVPIKTGKKVKKIKGEPPAPRKAAKQVMGQCKRCGYLSSQDICKACVLLEGLNKNRPKNAIEVTYEEQEHPNGAVHSITNGLKGTQIGGD